MWMIASTLQLSTLMMHMLRSGQGGYYDMYTAIHVYVKKSFTLFCTDLSGGDNAYINISQCPKTTYTCKWSQLNIFESATCIHINHITITFFAHQLTSIKFTQCLKILQSHD